MELTIVKSDDEILNEIESLTTQLSMIKKHYPKSLQLAMNKSWIELRQIWNSDKLKITNEDYNNLLLANLQVDKVNISINLKKCT